MGKRGVHAEAFPKTPEMFCSRCRTWQPTEGMLNSLSSIDGVPQRLLAWVCPACAGNINRNQDNEQLKGQREGGPKEERGHNSKKSTTYQNTLYQGIGSPKLGDRKRKISGSYGGGISLPSGIYMARRVDGAVKVGSTTKLEYRLGQLERQHGEMDLLHWIPTLVYRWGEIEVHRLLSPWRISGEWFSGEWYRLDDGEISSFGERVSDMLKKAPALATRRRGLGRPGLPDAERRSRSTDRVRRWRAAREGQRRDTREGR